MGVVIDNDRCSIARALVLLGERWSLQIVRDISNGVRRFEELRDHLGVARNVLSNRLSSLVEAGLLERVPYQEFGSRQRFEYALTPSGRELWPVLMALMAWGDRHLADGPPPVEPEHVGCGGKVSLVPVCEHGHVVEPARELGLRLGSATPWPGS
ncbi:winged helix-turn-helix transcriptional regulator [Saccharothrix luteola]|uniref:winged helix-turn-helix transcriptional regulator n=1 Tax=Saccharothrix luteola TaxID=2893018 RepID=UPI001E541349|nr:helix-turn-helix domain-containing protein [Saccharothrix luteola]MCC8248597.1 helix-turn-helix transcriptional regulator [Saccharothrix luteola]